MITSLQQAQSTSQELMQFMMGKKLRRCLCCDFSMAKSDHTITKGMVKGLIKFAEYSLSKRARYANPRLDMRWKYELTINEMTNWTKLRFFGLVAKHMVNGRHVGGRWVVTRNGWAFLRGELSIPAHVKTFRNRIVEKSEQQISIKDIMASLPNFPLHDEFYGDIVTADNLETVKTYDRRKKAKKATGRKCPMCLDGMLKNGSSDEIIVKDGVSVARVSYFCKCVECGFETPRSS